MFAIHRIPNDDGLSCENGDVVWDGNWDDYDSGGGTGHRGCKWWASRANPIYNSSCNAVRPKSFTIYIWKRIS